MNKKIWLMPLLLIMMLVAYFTMTKDGALRFAVILSGNPIEAFSYEVMDEPYSIYLEENQIPFSLENPPIDEPTQSELVNWVVTKNGIFYSAEYYGWG